jgi:hypothetical protein
MSSCTSFGCSLSLNGSNWFSVSDSYQSPTKAQGLVNSQTSLVVQPAYSQTDCATQAVYNFNSKVLKHLGLEDPVRQVPGMDLMMILGGETL